MLIATIDAGTSNTRVYLWQDTTILAEAQMPIGVRHTAIDRHNKKLTAAVRDTLREAARKAGVTMDDIACILGAGMLTSNVGLKEIPHLAAPISLDALSHAIVPCHLPEICPQVIHLIPGIKNMDDMSFTDETIGHMDIMRGEETEAAAILQCFPSIEHMVLVLPGSHNKYIAVSNGDTICGCLTTLAGELLHAMTFDTILASSTAQSYAEHYDAEAFQRGVVCRRHPVLVMLRLWRASLTFFTRLRQMLFRTTCSESCWQMILLHSGGVPSSPTCPRLCSSSQGIR